MWADAAVKCLSVTLLSCLKDKDLGSSNSAGCFSDLYFSSKSESMPKEKKRLSHLRHLLAWQTQARTHVLFPWSWQNGCQVTQLQWERSFRCQAYKLSSPESAALMQTVVSEWKPEQEGLLPWEVSMLCLNHTEGRGQSPCSKGLRLFRSQDHPSEHQGHWDDNGDWREASPRHRALGDSMGPHQQRHPPYTAEAPSLQGPLRWAWALTYLFPPARVGTPVGTFRQVGHKWMKWS